jgi:hypothetical protein
MTDFSPTNTADTLYVYSGDYGDSLGVLLEMAQKHFNDSKIDIDDINVAAENIHCRSVNYDLHCASDYDTYFVITLIE